MRIVGLIPARYHSTRVPAKMLAPIAGEPMICHVYRRACEAPSLHEVIVATDDERIRQAVEQAGGRAVLTRPDHPSGTDRLAEVAAGLDCDLVVNLQGDEPLMPPQVIEAALAPFHAEPDLRMGTVATPIHSAEEYRDSSAVKVVLDERGFALYFSRAPVPHFRVDTPGPQADNAWCDPHTGFTALKHIGLYVYRRETLLWLAGLPPTPLEQAEKLEQLRALGHGCPIRVSIVDYSPLGVDTPEDLQRVRAIMEGPQAGP